MSSLLSATAASGRRCLKSKVRLHPGPGGLAANTYPSELPFCFLGTLPTHRPAYVIAKLANQTPRSADAGSIPATLPRSPHLRLQKRKLHHVPSSALQGQLLAEVARVPRPGCIFAGTDSCFSPVFGLCTSSTQWSWLIHPLSRIALEPLAWNTFKWMFTWTGSAFVPESRQIRFR